MFMPLLWTAMAGCILLASLPRTARILHPIELMASYMFCCISGQIVLNIITLNLNKIKVAPSAAAFMTIEISRLIVLPCLCVWLLASYRRLSGIPLKALLTVAVLAAMALRDYAYVKTGVVQFHGWSPWSGLWMWAGIWLSVVLFHRLFTHCLRKGRAA